VPAANAPPAPVRCLSLSYSQVPVRFLTIQISRQPAHEPTGPLCFPALWFVSCLNLSQLPDYYVPWPNAVRWALLLPALCMIVCYLASAGCLNFLPPGPNPVPDPLALWYVMPDSPAPGLVTPLLLIWTKMTIHTLLVTPTTSMYVFRVSTCSQQVVYETTKVRKFCY
jgi:hypothetical protein